jgi:hypothetical protein
MFLSVRELAIGQTQNAIGFKGSSRPNSSTSINMRTQLAPITLVNSLLIVSIVVVQARREQIVAGLPLSTHRGQRPLSVTE